MKILKGFIIIFVLAGLLACNRKRFICAAYNTYFIHDLKEREQMFSPFSADSSGNQSDVEGTTAIDSKADIKSSNELADTFWNKKGDGKFQPKTKEPRKQQPNGLLIAHNEKSKTKAMNDIEMKVIPIKTVAKYSLADSSYIENSGKPTQDTL